MSNDAFADVSVTALRFSVRLVHCLQKERGASCSFHASKSVFQRRQTVEPARRDTDRALRKASMCMNSHNAKAILEKIRKATESKDVSFHRILVTYSTLISAIVHDGILKHTSVRADDEDDSTAKHGNLLPLRRRVPSYQDVTGLGGPNPQPVGKSHRRLQSENLRQRLPSDPTDFTSIYAEIGLDIPPLPQNKKKLLPRIDSLGSESPIDEADNVEPNPQSSIDFSETDDLKPTHLLRLLSLLETFVALTESIGVERATLCSILAAGPDSHHLFNVSAKGTLNDLMQHATTFLGLTQTHNSHPFVGLGFGSRKPTSSGKQAVKVQSRIACAFGPRFGRIVSTNGRLAESYLVGKHYWSGERL